MRDSQCTNVVWSDLEGSGSITIGELAALIDRYFDEAEREVLSELIYEKKD